jgi:hypothetical protein
MASAAAELDLLFHLLAIGEGRVTLNALIQSFR